MTKKLTLSDDDEDEDDELLSWYSWPYFQPRNKPGNCQRSSPLWISGTPEVGFEPAQSVSSGFIEWSCAVVITTTPRRRIKLCSSNNYFTDSLRTVLRNKIFLTWDLNCVSDVSEVKDPIILDPGKKVTQY